MDPCRRTGTEETLSRSQQKIASYQAYLSNGGDYPNGEKDGGDLGGDVEHHRSPSRATGSA
jgi:hypothetical protein